MLDDLRERKKSWKYLYLREDILFLMEFDLTAAIVCSVLASYYHCEFEHNINNKKGLKELWFPISRQVIRRSCLGLLGPTKIGEALHSLCKKGYLLKRSRNGGTVNEYLLLVSKLNEDLDRIPDINPFGIPRNKCAARAAGSQNRNKSQNDYSQHVLPINIDEVDFDEDPINIDEDPINIDEDPINIDEDPINIDITIRKNQPLNQPSIQGESTINHENNSQPIIEPQETLQPPEALSTSTDPYDEEIFPTISVDNLGQWLDTVCTVYRLRQPRTLPNKKGKELMVSLVRSIGREKIVGLMKEFLEEGNTSWDKFLQLHKSRGMARNEAAASAGARNAAPYRQTTRQYSKAPVERYIAKKPDPPMEALLWNERIPQRAWEIWSPALDAALQERLADADFVRCYGKILDRSVPIVEKNHPDSGYVNYMWILTKGNWMKLLNGGCDYLLKTEKTKAEVDTSMDEVIRLAEARERGEVE